jgi:hypothetical protein
MKHFLVFHPMISMPEEIQGERQMTQQGASY